MQEGSTAVLSYVLVSVGSARCKNRDENENEGLVYLDMQCSCGVTLPMLH